MQNEYLKLDLLFDSMTNQEKEYAIKNQLPYFFSKAYLFLKLGTEKYRLNDYLKQPSAEISAEELAIITLGCKQIIEGKGLFSYKPFMHLDVSGFSLLMHFFHFKSESRNTTHNVEFEGIKGVLDCINFVHLIDSRKARLFNFCKYT
jgi:hypothetical protein